MKMFALKNTETGDLAGFSISSNGDAEFAGDTQISVEKHRSYDEPIWMVCQRVVAEKAAVTDTPWYNAGWNTPSNDYVGEWEVVEIEITIK
jgi:hypothetical protein